jgi:hypothetical protein
MRLTEKYINGLKKAYFDNNFPTDWEHFEMVKHGASKEDILKIKAEYPSAPDSLFDLLEYVDGTYHREYQGKEIAFYFLGSDVDEYDLPYYLLSSEQILEEAKLRAEYSYGLDEHLDWVNEHGYYELYDDKLTDDPDKARWLCFSHCMNNGGFSVLYIDFSPSEKGKVGQVVRFLHDPDQYKVIADSFDDYLEMLMDNDYRFISEDII